MPASTIVSEGFHFSSGDKQRCTEDDWDVFRMRSCQVCVVHEPSLFVKGCFFANRATAQAFGTIWEALRAWSRFCFISEAVSSSYSTEPYITGRDSSRFQSKSRQTLLMYRYGRSYVHMYVFSYHHQQWYRTCFCWSHHRSSCTLRGKMIDDDDFNIETSQHSNIIVATHSPSRSSTCCLCNK